MTTKSTARNAATSFDFAAAMLTLKQEILSELRGTNPAPAPVVAPEAPKARKTKPAVAPVATTAPATKSEPVNYELEGKKKACFTAAKAAVKAAGLAWNGVKGAGSKGGKYENPTAYWAAYWAGYNAKAKELGIPEHTK